MVRNWSYVKGKRRVKVVPSCAVLVTATVPLWAWAMSRAMASPAVAAGVGAGLATVVFGVGGVVGAGRIGAIEAVEQMR